MSQVFVGARAQFKVNEAIVALASSVNVTVENTLTDVDVLGMLEVADLAETAHKCNFSVNVFKPIKAGTSFNAASAAKNAAGAGIDASYTNGPDGVAASDITNLFQDAGFSCEILDEITGEVVFQMTGCKFQGGSGSIDARGLWTGTWNFKAVRGIGI